MSGGLTGLFLPLQARFTGEGWPGKESGSPRKIWILSDDPNGALREVAAARWPGARLVDQGRQDFSLTPPNPQRQHFEWVQLQLEN